MQLLLSEVRLGCFFLSEATALFINMEGEDVVDEISSGLLCCKTQGCRSNSCALGLS